MRRRGGIALGAGAGLGAVVLLAAVVAMRAGNDESLRRPDLVPGETTRIVGGGTTGLDTVRNDPVDAREVQAGGLVAMAVEDDGTLWLVDGSGRVFLADPERGLVRAPAASAPATDLYAAAAMDGDDLLTVTDQSRSLVRIDTVDSGRGQTEVEVMGLPEEVAFTGIAVAEDGTVYVADGLTGTVYAVDAAGRATAVPGTPSDQCWPDRYPTPTPIRLAVRPDGAVVVGDPLAQCPSPYVPGQGIAAMPPDCPTDNQSRATPGPIVVDGDQFVAAGEYCDLVWGLLGGGAETSTVLSRYDVDGSVTALAIDGDGRLYILDETGVTSTRLTPAS